MPTDKPKISAYVSQSIYDRFKEYQLEHNLSMSHAVIVILSEYFGLEETIKENVSSSPVGGVTLQAFTDLQHRLKKVELEVERLKSTDVKNEQKKESVSKKITTNLLSKPITEKSSLPSEPPKELIDIPSGTYISRRQLAKLIGKGSSTIGRWTNKKVKAPSWFEELIRIEDEKGKKIMYKT